MKRQMMNERGGVSIFIVIFTALLVTIVTASFTQLMLRNQDQALNSDLSQSAYDSALAGVEDAKRALIRFKECQQANTAAGDDCVNAIREAFDDPNNCEALAEVDVAEFNDGEVRVGDEAMNQAYTCVTVQLETDAIEGELNENESTVIPLNATGDATEVVLSWFTMEDAEGALNATPSAAPGTPLPVNAEAGWSTSTPALMRAQFIQSNAGGEYELNDFDGTGTNSAQTLFLYPKGIGGDRYDFDADSRRGSGASNSARPVTCTTSYTNDGYSCSVTLELPNAISGNREAYLQLEPIYNATTFKVTALDASGDPLLFDGVQPLIDSTGRASDFFRRVQAKVTLTEGGLPLTYPSSSALTATSGVCKDFFITDDTADYTTNCP